MDAECLQMSVYAANATMGPEGLFPMLLVFGALPRPARSFPSITLATATSKGYRGSPEIGKLRAGEKAHLIFLTPPRRAEGERKSEQLMNLPEGSPVLLFKTEYKRWEGSYKFVSLESETVIIQLYRDHKIFRSTCFKPCMPSLFSRERGGQQPEVDDLEYMAIVAEEDDQQGVPRNMKVRKQSLEKRAFAESKKDELQGLSRDGTFMQVIERHWRRPADFWLAFCR